MTSSTAPSAPARWERWIPLHPALFAAYPVLFLWSQNLGETDPADVVPPLLGVIAVAAVTTLVLAFPFRDVRRPALIVTPIVLALLMYGHAANLLHPLHVRPVLQQIGWVALAGLGVVAAVRLGPRALATVDTALDRVGMILIAIALVLIVPFEFGAVVGGSTTTTPGLADVSSVSGRPLRDVYYLILDRYGSDQALALRYGVQNDMTAWLTEYGFRVLAGSHANYVKTSLSMASTLNMTHLLDLAAQEGRANPDHAPVFAMLQNPRVVQQFRALGYRYDHIGSYYGPTRTDSGADRNLYVGGPSDFMAVLEDTSALPVIQRRLKISTGQPLAERAYANGRFGWEALASLRDEPGPKFVFGHFLLPHTPYVFDRDGSYMDGARSAKLGENERFARQLAWTNDQLRQWIKSLIALPEDRRPIIILQADEGPYPLPFQRDTVNYDWSTATRDQLLEKYGILNAWYVPGAPDIGLYDDITSVNTFPVLFSGYFGLDIPRLPDRIYTSARKLRPYDLTDVTDRIAPAP